MSFVGGGPASVDKPFNLPVMPFTGASSDSVQKGVSNSSAVPLRQARKHEEAVMITMIKSELLRRIAGGFALGVAAMVAFQSPENTQALIGALKGAAGLVA